MEHENLLDVAAFWDDVQKAIAILAGLPFTPMTPANPSEPPPNVTDPAVDEGGVPANETPVADTPVHSELPEGHSVVVYFAATADWREPLKSAATRLLTAREV